jgi:beta-aspartyl-peptidase (threonine type)
MKAIIVHGGAGDIKSAKRREEVPVRVDIVKESTSRGYSILKNVGSAIDAVVTAVKVLEDNPVFDAGKGSYLNEEGEVEMDAGIMDGSSLSIGAVAGIKRVKNPIELARVVMEKSPYNFLIGEGAEEFGKKFGIKFMPLYYFYTERLIQIFEGRFGDTVGAVALDDTGRIAVAVSTGGTPNKYKGRIGDSPLVGSGFYANNLYGAVTTGIGEDIMKVVLSFRIMLYYPKIPFENAVRLVIEDLTKVQGHGGIIALDKDGNISFAYNTEGMFRAYIKDGMSEPEGSF